MSGSRCRYRANISESPTPSSSRHAFRAAEPRRTSLAVRQPLRIASCDGTRWKPIPRGRQASTTVMLCSPLDRLLIEVSLEGQTQPIANPSYPRAALLGVELNAEIEYQTAGDSTIGAEKPLGARGAVMADTIGAKQA